MSAPRQIRESMESDAMRSYKEHKHYNADDPVEKEVRSTQAILDRVLTHPIDNKHIVNDVEDIVKWWSRTEALLSMYKSGGQIMDYIAIGLAKLGVGQILSQEQYDHISQTVRESKKAIEARFAFYDNTFDGKNTTHPLTQDTLRVRRAIESHNRLTAPVPKARR